MRKPGLFTSPDGKTYVVVFILVSSLFLLWGFCNGMIDVMDRHFQKELGLTLAQSSWVQFAHYLGYFLMALPAGWLAEKLGYKGGIIAGLLMVALGGFWFIEATKIATFWAFLLGVGVIASGLTFLETVANPYTTVLGPKEFSATRINLAQSCNGLGSMLGPLVGAQFFYSLDSSGKSTGSETLWIPYAAVGVFVLVLAAAFSFTKMPDPISEDEFHLDDAAPASALAPSAGRVAAPWLLLANIVVLASAIGMIFSAIVAIPAVGNSLGLTELKGFLYATGALVVVGLVICLPNLGKVTNHSIWSHPHFSGATLAQFFYVAAPCGIFAYFINYMTTQPPAMPGSFASGWFSDWFTAHGDGLCMFSDKGASKLASVGLACFLLGRVVGAWLLARFSAHLVLGCFAGLSALCSLLVFSHLGWISAVALFLTFFFMSITFPTIFSLGIHGLGAHAKKASSFIVMAIMGGAIMPKLMGHIADTHGMSTGFVVPTACFVLVAWYAFSWSKLSGQQGLVGVKTGKGH